jgi:Holliday junction resolvase RusA-like endonuclease
MIRLVSIIIPGLPVPWAAHQGFGRKAFNPKWREKAFYQHHIQQQWKESPKTGSVMIEATYHMPIPKAFSKKKTTQAIEGKIFPVTRPDIDNFNKFLNDCLKGIILEDDNQVAILNVKKIFSKVPQTEVHIYSI